MTDVASLRAALLLAVLASCRSARPPAIDPALAAMLPANAQVLAGLDLQQLRASPFYAQLPQPVLALSEPLGRASYLLAAYDGKQLAMAARGDFGGTAPSGFALIAPGIAAANATPGSGPPAILPQAESIALGHTIWLLATGGATLPLAGNARNLNSLLHRAESTAIGADLRTGIALHLTARCRSADAAGGFEESLRGLISLTSIGLRARQPQLAAVLDSTAIERRGGIVEATLSLSPEAASRFLAWIGK